MKTIYAVFGILLAFIVCASCRNLQYNVEKQMENATATYEECDCKGGFCEVDGNGTNTCKCPPEYGVFNKNECRKCDCGKDANCTVATVFPGIYKVSCICPEGYMDSNQYGCIGDCRRAPCKNGGTCSVVGRIIKCHCIPPYSGEYCQQIVPSGTYEFESTTSRSTFLTSTPPTYAFTSTAILSTYKTEPPATSSRISTTTADVSETMNVTMTITKIGTTGNDSKMTDSQDPLSTSILSTVSDSNITRIDWCAFNPCQNGGICTNGKETYKCSCVGFYAGKNCSENTWCDKYGEDLCGKVKCEYKETVGRGYCVCEDGKFFHKSSKTCRLDRCAYNPCKNGGSCIDEEDTFKCICVDFYGGKDCSENTWCDRYGEDLCGREKCQYNDKTGRGHCVCEDGKVFNIALKACTDYRYMIAAVLLLVLLASICFCCGCCLFRMTHIFLLRDSTGYKTLPGMT